MLSGELEGREEDGDGVVVQFAELYRGTGKGDNSGLYFL